jgi:hypothetical protein
MNDSDRLVSVWAFLAAIRERVLMKPVPYRPRVFAKVIQELRESNSYATRFPVYTRSGGPHAPDFEDGIVQARAAGLIARGVPDYDHFTILMSKRVAEKYLQWAAPPPEVQAVADQYLQQVDLLPE